MSTKPKTHQERAEKAARVINVPGTSRDIARETFPTELVEASGNTALNAELSPDPRMDGATDVYLVPAEDIEALRAALALYPEAT